VGFYEHNSYGIELYRRLLYSMPVAGPLPFPKVTGVWERRRGVGWRIGKNINKAPKPPKGRRAFVFCLYEYRTLKCR
jgi:hypothetical protein